MAQDKDGTSTAVAPATNTRHMLTLAGIGLALMLLSAGGTWFVLKWWMNDVVQAGAEKSATEEPAVVVKQKPIYYPLEQPVLVSFGVRGQQRFLQAQLTLMTRDPVVADALAEHHVLLQSSLMMLFSSQDYNELQTVEGKELLRQLALTEVQRLMEQETGSPGVEQVLFTAFVMQ